MKLFNGTTSDKFLNNLKNHKLKWKNKCQSGAIWIQSHDFLTCLHRVWWCLQSSGKNYGDSHARTDVSVSEEMRGKPPLLQKADLSVYLFPSSLPPFIPPSYPEASQTQMFYTSYEMFEGRRHSKSAWAWFLLQGSLLSLSPLHACSNLPQHGCASDLVTSMYNHPSNSCRRCINNSLEHTCSLMWCSKSIKKVEFRAKNVFFVSFLELRLIRLYMSVTGSYLTFLVHLDPSLLGKVHVHSNGYLLVNVESTFHHLEKDF